MQTSYFNSSLFCFNIHRRYSTLRFDYLYSPTFGLFIQNLPWYSALYCKFHFYFVIPSTFSASLKSQDSNNQNVDLCTDTQPCVRRVRLLSLSCVFLSLRLLLLLSLSLWPSLSTLQAMLNERAYSFCRVSLIPGHASVMKEWWDPMAWATSSAQLSLIPAPSSFQLIHTGNCAQTPRNALEKWWQQEWLHR